MEYAAKQAALNLNMIKHYLMARLYGRNCFRNFPYRDAEAKTLKLAVRLFAVISPKEYGELVELCLPEIRDQHPADLPKEHLQTALARAQSILQAANL